MLSLVTLGDDNALFEVRGPKVKLQNLPKVPKKLGIVRKCTSASLAGKTHNFKRTGQIFCYLVVLDFESTCWQDRWNIPQEIIEFPAVLLNTSTGEIEREFQHYVQPSEKPILSDFCKQLTGISQEQVDDGIPLNLCLSRFSHWLRRLAQEKNISYNTAGAAGSNRCTFVTWSDWDLGVCLAYESRRKQLRSLAPLSSWIDLRATYRKFYSRRPSGLNGALLDLGIVFEGRQHSGLDDARNTAKLAWRMICDGCLMTVTKTLNLSWRGQNSIGQICPQPNLGTATLTTDKLTSNQTGHSDSVLSQDKCVDKKSDNGHAAAKPAVSVVRPGSGHAAAKPAGSVVRPDNGHAAAKPAVSVVRPGSGHAAAKPAGSVVRPDNGHAAAKPAVSVVRPDNGHAAAKPAVSVVRPDNGHAAAKPAVSVVRPDNGHAAAKPAVSVVRPDNGHAAAKSQFSASRNHHVNTDHNVLPRFTSLKPTCAKVFLSNSNVAPRDITNFPCDAVVASTTKGNATFQDSCVLSKPVDSPACQKYYVESTPSPCDGHIENNKQHSRLKTPSVTPDSGGGRLLKTPPLCRCGRRCKRHYVQSPGANVGRSFFCCPLGRRSVGSGKSPTSCGFFQWEQTAMKRRHTSSPATLTGGTVSKSAHFSSSSTLLPQPNFDTPGSKVKVGHDRRCLR